MRGPKIGIVTDSSSDLPPDLAAQQGIHVVPLNVHFGSRNYVDQLELTAAAFWDKLRKAREMPTTTAPSVEAFTKAYQDCLARHAQEILVLCGVQADTHAAAVTAAGEIDLPVRVVDSHTLSIALGMMATAAAEAANLGANSDDAITAANRNRPELLGTVATLANLRNGRRIGSTQAFLGKLMNLKPLITIEDGAIKAVGRALSRTQALTALMEWLGDRSDAQQIAIVHGNAPDIGGILARLRDHFPGVEPRVVLGGPVIAIEAGPGFIGLAASRG